MSQKNFADFLHERIEKTDSVLCVGIDPVLESFPQEILESARATSSSDAEFVYHAIMSFYSDAIDGGKQDIACIKPNIAFFERYGTGALKALQELAAKAKQDGIPVILDAKRGDIGNTAKAYAASYFGGSSNSIVPGMLDVDALTVNPYLGFDTLEPYLPYLKERGKGLFVLVRTSNAGADDIQGLPDSSAVPVFQRVAEWLAHHGDPYNGRCGFSALGAVVGAPYTKDARILRTIMARQCVLIPGYGAQGGSAQDAVQALDHRGIGGVINSSRGIFGGLEGETKQNALIEIEHRMIRNKQHLNKARINTI